MRLPRRHRGRHAGPRPRRQPAGRPRRSMLAHLGRAGVRMMARTLVAAVVLVGLANLAPPADTPTTPYVAPPTSPAQLKLMKRYDCSPDGFGDGGQPRSAIIREGGDLRVVSFDRGWQVYTGSRPNALVAVCQAPPG